jgi:hypothetical protein
MSVSLGGLPSWGRQTCYRPLAGHSSVHQYFAMSYHLLLKDHIMENTD